MAWHLRFRWSLPLIALGLLIAGWALADYARRTAKAQVAQGYDLALVLAIDCSFSVDSREFRLQMEGLGRAFQDPEVQAAITRGPNGRIAVTAVQWADDRNQTIVMPWTTLDSAAAAASFGSTLETMPRNLLEGGTAIGSALRLSAGLFNGLPMPATRRVIDISSDGRNNVGPQPEQVRLEAAAQGVTINALVIVNEWPGLDQYFSQNVIVGDGAFVIVANDYEAYAKAMIEKLLREMTGPGTS